MLCTNGTFFLTFSIQFPNIFSSSCYSCIPDFSIYRTCHLQGLPLAAPYGYFGNWQLLSNACRQLFFPYVGMIQIRFPGQDIFSLLSARSDYGLTFSFNDLHYTTLLIFAQCIMTVICCIVNIFDHDIISVISVGLNKYTVSDLMSLYRFAEW